MMSDRFGVEIQIGGQLPVAKVQDLIDAINSEGMSLDWGECPIRLKTREDLINCLASKESPIILVDDERAWGDIDGLEETCRNLKLTFKTFVSPKYEFNGELRYYSPVTGLIELECDVDCRPIIKKEDLQEILSSLNLGRTDGAINKIKEFTRDFSAPKFEITEK
jgi:hypothetical protein